MSSHIMKTQTPKAAPITPTTASDQRRIVSCRCRNNKLQEIVYRKDDEKRRLAIFGEIGIVCHIIRSIHVSIHVLFSRTKECKYEETVDMRGYTLDGVKNYIEDHCIQWEAMGFTQMEDPNYEIYQAMSASPPAPPRMLTSSPSQTQVPMCVAEEAVDSPPLREESLDALPLLSHSVSKLSLYNKREYLYMV